MMLLDLEELRFTQAQVLEMVPSLQAKTLQNWNARGILHQEGPAPGRQGKRLYSAAGVIGLSFLAGATDLGIAPADAASMLNPVLDHALALHDAYPAEIDAEGIRTFTILGSSPHLYSRGYIYRYSDGYSILITRDGSERVRSFAPRFYIVTEVDYLILNALDAVYRCAFGAGRPASGLPELTPEKYDAMEAVFARFDPNGERA